MNNKLQAKLEGEYNCSGDAIKSLKILKELGILVTGSREGTGSVWNLKDMSIRAVLLGHADQLVSIDYCSKTKMLLTGSWDTSQHFYDFSHLPKEV